MGTTEIVSICLIILCYGALVYGITKAVTNLGKKDKGE